MRNRKYMFYNNQHYFHIQHSLRSCIMYKFVYCFYLRQNIQVYILSRNYSQHKHHNFELNIALSFYLLKIFDFQCNNRYQRFYWCTRNHLVPNWFPKSSLWSIMFQYNQSVILYGQCKHQLNCKKRYDQSLMWERNLSNLSNKCKCSMVILRSMI